MPSYLDRNVSIKVSRFYMRVVGIWYAETEREKRMLNGAMIYSILALLFALVIVVVDLFHVWGDFHETTTGLLVVITVVSAVIKLLIAIGRKDAIIDLLIHSKKYFWEVTYDSFSEQMLDECERKGIILLCSMACAVQGTAMAYLINPFITDNGSNDTQRALPFTIWIDLPMSETPYYEIFFTVECLTTTHSAICFFCFDNLLCILNIHLVGQFKILQHRLETLCDKFVIHVDDENENTYPETADERFPKNIFNRNENPRLKIDFTKSGAKKNRLDLSGKAYNNLKECVKQHLLLFNYVERLEYIFSPILLYHIGFSSLILCLAGFESIVAKRGESILHMISAAAQILIFTWTCDEIIDHSMGIEDCAFRSKWYTTPDTEEGRSIRTGLIIIMMRSRRACFLTAGKLRAISLQTFTSILGTTSSYLSVLRQMGDEI
ncbi:odorant receptor 83a-like [Diprion similis]|uniref:odorant receptor 83a-like n=1 Tax=Diprion similis TaxID=362088 RepID=UPI001EF7D189|nr:odorant receptor 83a-like [Diprion similis]